jgi:hypothetical protein
MPPEDRMMRHDLIKMAKGMLYCRACKLAWQESEHHLARMTQCVVEWEQAASSIEDMGARLIARWQKEIDDAG